MTDTSKEGRPTVMTKETIQKLEDGFLKGYSDREACLYADIATSTLYLYCKENPDFSERKEQLKDHVKMRAKTNIHKAIVEDSNLSLSQWYVERKDPEFRTKQDITTDGQALTVNVISYADNDSPPVQS